MAAMVFLHLLSTKFPEVSGLRCELRWNRMIFKVLLMPFFPARNGLSFL